MTALAVVLTFMVLLLAVLVLGLLRSHADILRALHSLGAGIGDPSAEPEAPAGPVPVALGPPLPGERGAGAFDVLGSTVDGDAVAVAMTAADLTLLAFLSAGCTTCSGFWSGLRGPESLGLPPAARLVIVPKGAELEEPQVLRRLSPPHVEVVLSTQAWLDYEVPGAPYFVLVDGTTGRRVGEGLASTLEQVAGLVRRAVGDGERLARRPAATKLDGPEREEDNDLALLASGIRPGDPSLYPSGPNGPAAR